MKRFVLSLAIAGCSSITPKPEPELTEYPLPTNVLSVACGPVHRERPRYPQVARQSRATGWVVAALTVDGDGRVRDVVLLESSPDWLFDRAAKVALQRWRYCRSSALARVTHVKLTFAYPG